MPIQEANVAGMKEGIKEALLAKEETMEGASLAEEEIMHGHRLPSRGEKYAELVVAPHLKCFPAAASLIRGICKKLKIISRFWQKPLCNDMWKKNCVNLKQKIGRHMDIIYKIPFFCFPYLQLPMLFLPPGDMERISKLKKDNIF